MFLGARDFLASQPKLVVMFECEADWCARAGYHPQDVFDLLGSLGFDIYTWDRRSRFWDDASSLSGTVRYLGRLDIAPCFQNRPVVDQKAKQTANYVFVTLGRLSSNELSS